MPKWGERNYMRPDALPHRNQPVTDTSHKYFHTFRYNTPIWCVIIQQHLQMGARRSCPYEALTTKTVSTRETANAKYTCRHQIFQVHNTFHWERSLVWFTVNCQYIFERTGVAANKCEIDDWLLIDGPKSGRTWCMFVPDRDLHWQKYFVFIANSSITLFVWGWETN